MPPNDLVLQRATPVSPGCVVASTWLQSVIDIGIGGIFMALAYRKTVDVEDGVTTL
jgi:hypothetical protein